MKKPDLIKQLANRINQSHVIESWIDKIEKAAYNKGYKDAESKQCNIPVVSGSLLEIDLIDWNHTCGDGCCYTYGQDITLNSEKLDEQNAEDSKNALTAVLTKLGYNVEINYR